MLVSRLGLFAVAAVVAWMVPGSASARDMIVGFAPHADVRERAAALADAGAVRDHTVTANRRVGVVQVARPAGQSAAATVRALRADPRVTFALADITVHAADDCEGSILPINSEPFTSDPLACRSWHLRPGTTSTVEIGDEWPAIAAEDPVTVAVVDSGIDMDHPDLAAGLWTDTEDDTHGYDFVDGDADPDDESGHGTNVAGIIGAQADNGLGVAGLCPRCELMSLRVLDENGGGGGATLDAIAYAAEHGAQVVNLSLEATASEAWIAATAHVLGSYPSVVFVIAAGNNASSNDDVPTWPCNAAVRVDNAICVAATTSADELADFSNWGSTVELAAPGELIFTTVQGGGYDYFSGTSAAAPVVAAATAILRARGASASQAVQALVESARQVAPLAGEQPSGRIALDGALDLFATWQPPDTIITSAPPATTSGRVATFAFTASEPDSSFQCSRDDGAWYACATNHSWHSLTLGEHTFEVRAVNAAGNPDRTPASAAFRVVDAPPLRPTLPTPPPPEPHPSGDRSADEDEPDEPVRYARNPRLLAPVGKATLNGNRLRLRVRCRKACTVRVIVRAGKRRLLRRTVRLPAGKRRTLRVRLSRSQLRSLRAGKRKLRVTVSAGRRTKTHTVRLARR